MKHVLVLKLLVGSNMTKYDFFMMDAVLYLLMQKTLRFFRENTDQSLLYIIIHKRIVDIVVFSQVQFDCI